ncbi:hypothetical protein GCG54_00015268 [Colletotrichum gloeosporioides]|uniref:Uncharacterized protein n=1 Tax=Colletotrichum gloeosporioides TaxID=474922 RepID=A0A8H4FDD1_COLGL|nr:uncharacterized protein GCG54_00015268 [Colletotrichum gloeosporioides]KAF3798288.1 hypothetical protein GCG54_00015268 [Colletotrichum gloeosporioides]
MGLVHHTVKEFLTQKEEAELFIDSSKANEEIFTRCLAVLRESGVRIRIKSQGCAGFLRYACLSWSTHLSRVESLGRQPLRDLSSFFQSHAILAWIDAIGICGNLRALTQASKHLTGLLERQRTRDAEQNPITLPLMKMAIIASWAIELIRIVGKLGHHIVRHSSAVHSLIPAFCPSLSIMAKQCAPKGPSAMSITGITNPGWDDSSAKFTVGSGTHPTEIACLDGHFAILTSEDVVNPWIFIMSRRFGHEYFIIAVKSNQDGDKVATCGSQTIKVWCVATAGVLHKLPNPLNLRAMEICFSKHSTRVLICCDDSSIRS